MKTNELTIGEVLAGQNTDTKDDYKREVSELLLINLDPN
jgi:hypothetical protein